MGIIYSDYELLVSEVAEELVKLWEVLENKQIDYRDYEIEKLEQFEEVRDKISKNFKKLLKYSLKCEYGVNPKARRKPR